MTNKQLVCVVICCFLLCLDSALAQGSDDGGYGNGRGLGWGRGGGRNQGGRERDRGDDDTTTTTTTAAPYSSDDDDPPPVQSGGRGQANVNNNYRRSKTRPPNKDAAFEQAQKPATRSLLGMAEQTSGATEEIVPTDNQVTLPNGDILKRYDHKINNVRVWNSGATVVEKNSGVRGLAIVSTSNPSNTVVLKFARGASRSMPPDPDASLNTCKNYYKSSVTGRNLTTSSDRFIYDYGSNASNPNDVVYADMVELRAGAVRVSLNESKPAICYRCLVDTNSQTVKETWSCINHGWDGGNSKSGKYTYGSTSGREDIVSKVKKLSSTQCQLTNSDGTINVYHMNSGSSDLSSSSRPYTFSCSSGPTDGTTRAYGVLADSFYNAVKAVEMFKNSSWGALTKLTPTGILNFAVHFQKNFDNAYWDGTALYFGDGYQMFYPLGTCLDVVAHEIGHAVTDVNSELIYSGEPGCLNEGFSDAMGKMAEFYATGKNDWCVARNCMLSDPCLRDMTVFAQYSHYFPTPDTRYCKYGTKACQDPHTCSAVPNYIFYKLATSARWNSRLAGQAWIIANRFFWREGTTLKQSGCDVASAVKQYQINGGDTLSVVNAWKAGGIDLSSCVSNPTSGTGSGGSGSGSGSTVTTTTTTTRAPVTTTTTRAPGKTAGNPIRISNCDSEYNTAAVSGENRYYVVYVPYGSTYQNVQIYGDNGDADLYIQVGRVATEDDYKWSPYWTGSNEWVVGDISDSGRDYYITVAGSASYKGLEVYACYY